MAGAAQNVFGTHRQLQHANDEPTRVGGRIYGEHGAEDVQKTEVAGRQK